MKTKLHLTLLAALCTMAALFTTSCSDDEPDRPTTEEEAAQMLVGQWKAIKVKKTNGNTSDIDNWYWEFTADGRFFVINHVSPNATGRYEAYRNKWVIDETYGMAVRSYTLNFEPNDPTIFAVNLEGETEQRMGRWRAGLQIHLGGRPHCDARQGSSHSHGHHPQPL